MNFLFLLVGIILGGVIGWMWATRRASPLVDKTVDEVQSRLRDAFAHVSTQALEKNNKLFLDLADQRFATLSKVAAGTLDERKAQIEGLVKPLQELLGTYQTRLTDIENSRNESYGQLRNQLGQLTKVQEILHTQTHELVSALRRPTTRGRWGEIALKRLVELAGMTSRCDFFEQATVDTDDGKQRPDMVIHLPGNRQVVVDCKAVLDAFIDAAETAEAEKREAHLKRHSEHVRGRAKELAKKGYWSQFKHAPEFVVMFLPGEAFLYAAVEQDARLLEECLKEHVIVATPTTLMALLKAIEFGWQKEDVSANVEEIRKLGKELHDRIGVLAEHFQQLGKNLNSAVQQYNATLSSLESRALLTARRISELGARSDRTVPELRPIDNFARDLNLGRDQDQPNP